MMAMIFHRAWFEAMFCLSVEDRRELMAAIVSYVFSDTVPSNPDTSSIVRALFCVIKAQIDADVAAGKYKDYEYDEGEDK